MRYILATFLAIGFASGAVTETEKDRKAEKQEATAPAAKTAKTAKSPRAAKTASQKTKQTPFGPVEATSEQPQPAANLSSDPFVSVEEQGEMVIFRRKTPFGSQVWKKKKSALTDDERALLARGRPEAPKPPSAEGDAPANENTKPEAGGKQ
jgi:hypothetical protein